MSDPKVVEERGRPPFGQVLFDGVLWLIGNYVGSVLLSLFILVVLMAAIPSLDQIIRIQIQVLGALIFSSLVLKFASVLPGERIWSVPYEPILNKKALIAIIVAWQFLNVLLSIIRSFVFQGDFLVRLSPAKATPIPTLTFTIAIFIVFIIPVAEELFCRRWLWARIEDVAGTAKAFWWTAALFWLMHIHFLWSGYEVFSFVSLIPLSLTLSFLRLKCGSVTASISLHIFNNFLAIAPGHILRFVS